jgi:hypothetical protein
MRLSLPGCYLAWGQVNCAGGRQDPPMNENWESEIAGLLTELSAAQADLLALLDEKRAFLVQRNHAGLHALQPREDALIQRLQACHQRRQELLCRASGAGLPFDSISELTDAVSPKRHGSLQNAVEEARGRARLLQHQSLANWVFIQRTLLHLSQMIEIIATGGRMQPTYGERRIGTGALVDRAI